MLPPVSRTVRLSCGSVTLRAWGAHVADSMLTDLLTLTVTLGLIREEWPRYARQDVEQGVWGAFWRLVHASLDGCTLPSPLTWDDRLALLEALWELNDLEAAEKRLTGLNRHAAAMLTRIQARMTPSTSGSSAPLA